MSRLVDQEFRRRFHGDEAKRPDDDRSDYDRDKARVLHSAAFRRLQGKTQVMGVGEGDFHRTRLTHSIEAAQIGEGLARRLQARHPSGEIRDWLPDQALVAAACYAHDLGHPPFGHGGETALHGCMRDHGGFEGNAQTLRLLTKLETYRRHQGINPTRRMILAVLKYPVAYDRFPAEATRNHPPKCHYALERDVVAWALDAPFSADEWERFTTLDARGKAHGRTLDASVMELADDIAYGVHDLEDAVGRGFISRADMAARLDAAFAGADRIGCGDKSVARDDFLAHLFEGTSSQRKAFIGALVNLLVTEVRVEETPGFAHPLLRYRARLPAELTQLLAALKDTVMALVIRRARIQQLERRGQRIVRSLFEELSQAPDELIPLEALADLGADGCDMRRVSDYVASMTDPYAQRIYNRLFTPGFGSSGDEL